MRSTLAHWFILLIGSCAIVPAVHAQAYTAQQPSKDNTPYRESVAHVGEVLPAGIEVFDRDDNAVDLRGQLHGPLIVFTIMTNHVPPGWLDGIRESGGKSLDGTGAGIAIIVVSGDTADTRLDVPASVAVFRHPVPMESGFLGGHIYPTTFYFDERLKLVRRRPGIPASASSFNQLLHFPSS